MRNSGKWLVGLTSVSAALAAGCSQQTLNSARHDAQRDINVIDQTGKQAAQQARPQIAKAGLGARVTAALEAAGIHGIRVDAGPNGVTLVGRVPTQSQKTRVIQIAHETLGPGKVIRSRIIVKAK